MGKVAAGRAAKLFDHGDYEELFAHEGSVYLCAKGRRDNRPLMVIASDPEPLPTAPDLAGSLRRVLQTLALAESQPCPVVFLFDAPAMYQSRQTAFQGTELELLMGREGMGRLYYELARLVRKIPVLGGVFGNLAQAQAFPVAMCRALVMLQDASLSIARPDAVKAMLGEETDYQHLGGSRLHSHDSGICDAVVESEDEALAWLSDVLGYLPAGSGQRPPTAPPVPPAGDATPLVEVIPQRLDKPFEARKAIQAIVDRGAFLELGKGYAKEVVVGLARVEGLPLAAIVSNPQVNGGLMFPQTCKKLSRFIDFADNFNLPLVFMADAPGFMIGGRVERAGAVAAGAELFEAIARCSSPRLCVILRRAYTAGLYAMGGSGFMPQKLVALTGASISVYGPQAVERFLANLDLPEEEERRLRRRIEEEHSLEAMLERGLLDAVVSPQDLRAEITGFLGDQITEAE